ncbi:MAG: ABC transporter permease [Cyclobacteriaceae bacterium]|nr:ABC transporter permease [Cyclobacteriaceae bacterium]
MLVSYLRIALRSLLKNKVYSIITVSGLAIGLTGFVLIGLYIRKETSYDKYFAKSPRIYRINTRVDVNGIQNTYSGAHFPAAYDMKEEYPEVKHALTLYDPGAFQGLVPRIKYGDHVFSERGLLFTDSSFFTFFDFPLAHGDPRTALHDVNSMVITHEIAHKLFGQENPVGKMVTFNDSISCRITGVLAPIDFNTHLRFDYLLYNKNLIQSIVGRNIQLDDAYIGMWYYSYILLAPDASPEQLQKQFPDFVKRHYPPRYTDNHAALTLQNVGDIHLKSQFSGADLSPNGNLDYLFILSIIGALLLIIACINFVNLSTARYLGRAKEVGLRKVVGAQRIQLVIQFTGEAILITMLSGALSLAGVFWLMPFFNQLAQGSLEASELLNLPTLYQAIGFFVGIGLLSGIYPAVVLSGFQPIRVLKGMVELPGSNFNMRKVLVVLQFAVSITLIIGTIVVYNQLDFLRNKSMGFDREQIIILPVQGIPIFRQYPTFKEEVERLSNVTSVTNLSHDLGQNNLAYSPVIAEGKDEEQMVPVMYAGYDFLETFGIAMKDGRFFDRAFNSDSSLAQVVNESAVKLFGWSDPIGRKLKPGFRGSDSSRVIGVIKDFNFDPLKSGIGPLVIQFSGAFGNVAIKLGSGNNRSTIGEIEEVWQRLYPEVPFNYYFLDEGLRATYAEEDRISRVYTVFCSLALLIASMGMFALATYTIRKRLKEIGVRKILGASERGIILLIYRDFLLLILIAFAIATPASMLVFNDWLSGFAYHISLQPMFFLLAIGVVVIISWLTLAFQMIRASRLNPAVILKSE